MRVYLVTGATGCIGAWTVAELLREGERVVALDVQPGPGRMRLLLEPVELERVESVVGDVVEPAQLEAIVDGYEVTNVIHLAALQVPATHADPRLGSLVNVTGTTNLFELARTRPTLSHLVYASSVAALGDPGPSTLYGVFKRANEGAASVYWQTEGVSSIGLRPHTVYGVGRDQGLTSAPTHAMLAAATGAPYRIPFGGALQLQYARDVAASFIAASRLEYEGASVHNLGGTETTIGEVVDTIAEVVPESAGAIAHDGMPLPFPSGLDSSSFSELVGQLPETPLVDGVRETVRRFRELSLREGHLGDAVEGAQAPDPLLDRRVGHEERGDAPSR
jgi:UDP-glucuronate 4-epimerase